MPRSISNQITEKTLRTYLVNEGFSLSAPRKNGETGVDIDARRGSLTFHIEVIGHKKTGPARSKDFYEVFFRAISRLKDGAKRCVIALPHVAKDGLPHRARHYQEAWIRIGQAFPELELWLVDCERAEVTQTKWNDWMEGKA